MNLLQACNAAAAAQEWANLRQHAQELLAEAPQSAEAHYLYGLACFRCMDAAPAEASLCRAIHLAPANPASYTALVQLLVCDRRFLLAEEITDLARQRCAPAPEWLAFLADAVSLFNPTTALALLEQALALDAEHPLAACKKLDLLQSGHADASADQFVQNYSSRFPHHANAAVLQAMQAEHQGDLPAARTIYHAALACHPDSSSIRYNLARITGMLDDINTQQELLAPYRSLPGTSPASEVMLAELLFRTGKFAEAFPLYESRGKVGWRPYAPIPASPRWNGGSLAEKRLLIVYEQGFGDVLLGSRYLQPLLEQAHHEGAAGIGMLCHPQLYSLFAHSRLCDDVDLHFETAATGHYDYHIPILSIPNCLAAGPTSLPETGDALFPPAWLGEKWRKVLGVQQKPRIGIVWKSVSSARNALAKSLPDKNLVQLIGNLPDMEWIACAPGIDSPPVPSIRDVSMHVRDFADTAALFMQMDAIVSIDTGPAHLAGCLNRPQILLSQEHSDWRWLTDASLHSIWHPATTVIRQRQRDNWDSVVAPCVEAIRQLISLGSCSS